MTNKNGRTNEKGKGTKAGEGKRERYKSRGNEVRVGKKRKKMGENSEGGRKK